MLCLFLEVLSYVANIYKLCETLLQWAHKSQKKVPITCLPRLTIHDQLNSIKAYLECFEVVYEDVGHPEVFDEIQVDRGEVLGRNTPVN